MLQDELVYHYLLGYLHASRPALGYAGPMVVLIASPLLQLLVLLRYANERWLKVISLASF